MPAIVFHGDRDKTVHPRNADHLLEHYCPAKPTGSRDERADRHRGGRCVRDRFPAGTPTPALRTATPEDAPSRSGGPSTGWARVVGR